MPTAQQSLDLRTANGTRLAFVRPMLGVESVRALTGLSEDDILAEILSGKILWAWNLAGTPNGTPHLCGRNSVGSGSARRIYLRVWNRSVICWHNPDLSQPESLDTIINHILPHRRLSLRCTELMRAFNCSSQHVLNLVDAQLLTRVPGDLGPKESPHVTRASVVQFLTDRRLK